MKIHGVKREWSHPIFCMKKHYCPRCNEILKKIKTETVVNSKSEEAKNYDFSQAGGDGYMIGNIKFVRTAFRCDKCDKTYSIEELLKIEKGVEENRKIIGKKWIWFIVFFVIDTLLYLTAGILTVAFTGGV